MTVRSQLSKFSPKNHSSRGVVVIRRRFVYSDKKIAQNGREEWSREVRTIFSLDVENESTDAGQGSRTATTGEITFPCSANPKQSTHNVQLMSSLLQVSAIHENHTQVYNALRCVHQQYIYSFGDQSVPALHRDYVTIYPLPHIVLRLYIVQYRRKRAGARRLLYTTSR